MSSNALRENLDVALKFHDTIGRLHAYLKLRKRFPHAGQWKVIKAFFRDGKKIIQVQAGRKYGKTQTVLYIAWRFAIENPGAQIYIIAPTKEQGRKIYWTTKRLQFYGPQEFIDEHRESEKRTVFNICNDEGVPSSITIDGCDNVDALRGINPDLVFYEEVQDHSEEFDVTVMRPNLASKDAAIVAIGTPPPRECYYTKLREEIMQYELEGDPRYAYFEAPTSDNPYISKEWLARQEHTLRRSGRDDVWEREFMAKLVLGGASSVIPIWHRRKSSIIRPHYTLWKVIQPEVKRMDWYTFTDPGQTCFATLLIGVNRYTSQIFIMDEIYEKDRYKTTVGQIWPRVKELQRYLHQYDERWNHYYDPAASWFQVDLYDRFGVAAIPCQKWRGVGGGANKRQGKDKAVSRIIDIVDAKDQLFISDKCPGLIWELDNWVRKEDGTLPDKDDHCIDLFFYLLKNVHISINPDIDITERQDFEDGDENKKDLVTLKTLVEDMKVQEDPFGNLGNTILSNEIFE